METNIIYNEDCLAGIRKLPENSIDCCVTSPPYYQLRDYGVDGQIGLEANLPEYIDKLVQVFREVRRVLKPEGSLWLNLGDSYATSGGPHVVNTINSNRMGGSDTQNNGQSRKPADGLKPKDLMGVPWRVSFALQGFAVIGTPTLLQWADWLREAREMQDWQLVSMVEDRIRSMSMTDALRADGWWLRSDIIWAKKNCMPESVTDRPTRAHEYIFLLSKSAHYYYDYEAIKEPASMASLQRWGQNIEDQAGSARGNGGAKVNGPMKAVGGPKKDKQRGHSRRHDGFNDRWDGMTKEEQCTMGRNKRTVWTVATQPFREAHFATFPEKLIEPCILAGCPEKGIVLDPFMGSGTTGLVTLRLGRQFLGYELNPEYCAMANRRLSKVINQQRLDFCATESNPNQERSE